MASKTINTTDTGSGGLSNVKPALQPVVNAVKGGALAKKFQGHKKKIGDGSVTVQKTEKMEGNGIPLSQGGYVYGPEEASIKGEIKGEYKPQKVTYITSSGAKATGTSTTPKVMPGTTPDYYTQMQKLYQQAYDEQIAANNAALEAARQRAQETTDAQIAALGEQYQGTNRQLYRDYMNSRRALPQQMAAQGYSGGLSESSMLRLMNSYEEGLNENERARLAQEASYNQALAQQLYDAQMRTNEANTQAGQQRYSQMAAIQEAIYRDAQQRAATMAASGDFTEYKRLGFSDSEIAYLRNMWRKMNPQFA